LPQFLHIHVNVFARVGFGDFLEEIVLVLSPAPPLVGLGRLTGLLLVARQPYEAWEPFLKAG
jgi:hypothetical protein